MSLVRKILIANRGEIACRIIRTAKRLGIQTVAIYSDIDRNSKFVDLADQAYRVGGNQSNQSYLNSDKILEIAINTNCKALHPGFGFLSQNAKFAQQCLSNNVTFVGPPPSAIVAMGSKSQSKKIMIKANVPVVPGYHEQKQQAEYLKQEAYKIGYPVLIKAVSGGGGKGMRIVHEPSKFLQALEACQRQSLKSFKDDRVIIEKYIKKPRHIQVQIFGDRFNNYVHLFERDCSIQRRHQKVVEQAPSNMSQAIRQSIYKSAVDAARAVGYYNAGTVEFIFDLEQSQHYFMQMNTRLQVQHPISEMITGLDFVEWQLLVASGFALPKKQSEIKKKGHAIQLRIYAEDPFNNFLPGHGTLKYFKEPPQGQGVRIQTGIREHDTISTFYDPMIAKLVTYGANRSEAIQIMTKALTYYRVVGLNNNLKFLKRVINDPVFQAGDYDTSYIEKYTDTLLSKQTQISSFDIISALIIRTHNKTHIMGLPSELINYRNVKGIKTQHTIRVQQTSFSKQFVYQCEFEAHDEYSGQVHLLGKSYAYHFSVKNNNTLQIKIDHHIETKQYYCEDDVVHLMDRVGDSIGFIFDTDKLKQSQKQVTSKLKLKTPMPGIITKVYLKKGDKVEKGQPIIAMEAMKMQLMIRAESSCKIKSITVKEGDFIEAGRLIVELQSQQ